MIEAHDQAGPESTTSRTFIFSNSGFKPGYVKFRNRSRDTVIRAQDKANNLIEMQAQAGEFKEL